MTGRLHIPFPSNFLAVNTPTKKAGAKTSSLPPEEVAPHSFLSNNPARTASVSSESSARSSSSAPTTPPTGPLKEVLPQLQNFLTLNTKHASNRTASVDMSPGSTTPHTFLSNKPEIGRRPSA